MFDKDKEHFKQHWYCVDQRSGPSRRTAFEADKWDLEEWKSGDFETGKLIEGWQGKGWFGASDEDREGPLQDVLLTSNMLPVFSSRLKTAFETKGVGGMQFLPVQILNARGDAIANYFLVNVLYLASALDMERSDVERSSMTETGWISVRVDRLYQSSIDWAIIDGA